MQNYLNRNGWSIAIVGIGGFLAYQTFAMRGEVSEVKGAFSTINVKLEAMNSKLDALHSDISELKTDAKAAYIRFDQKHEALSNKINDVDKRLNSIEVSVKK